MHGPALPVTIFQRLYTLEFGDVRKLANSLIYGFKCAIRLDHAAAGSRNRVRCAAAQHIPSRKRERSNTGLVSEFASSSSAEDASTAFEK